MTQPTAAPVVLTVGVTTGLAAMLVSGYRITDCLSFRSGPGQCDSIVQENALALVTGGAALASAWGGFNTLNRKLHPVENPLSGEPAVVEGPPPLTEEEIEQIKQNLRQAFQRAVEAGVVEPLAPQELIEKLPPPPPRVPVMPAAPLVEELPEPALQEQKPEDLDDEIIELIEEGHTQREVAETLHVSRYRVRKALLHSEKE